MCAALQDQVQQTSSRLVYGVQNDALIAMVMAVEKYRWVAINLMRLKGGFG